MDDQYIFPIRPGKVNYLTGTMGELRSSHFHAGIDIKTGGRTGYEVYATSSGYINRIKIRTGGYGNAIYLQHDDGNISVYAHMDKLVDPLQQFMISQQYKYRNFEIDVSPGVNQFRFEKGDLLGWSGNSGSSSGPHLHFEIRDAYHRPLNPLTFNFAEIRDNIAPRALSVALVPQGRQSTVEGDFHSNEYNLIYDNGDYTLRETPVVTGRIGLEIAAFDRLNGVSNKNGYPCIDIFLDDSLVFSQQIDRLDFGKSGEIHLITNYRNYRKYQRLYRVDGFTYDIYDEMKNDGFIEINDSLTHKLKILLTDAYNNVREVYFDVKGGEKTSNFDNEIGYQRENYLLETVPSDRGFAKVYTEGLEMTILPENSNSTHEFYRWDLRTGLPDSIQFGSRVRHYKYGSTVYPGQYGSYKDDAIELQFYPSSFYDTTFFIIDHYNDEVNDRKVYEVGNPFESFTARTSFRAIFKPENRSDRLHLYEISGRSPTFIPGDWEKDNYVTNLSGPGSYSFIRDTIAPVSKWTVMDPNSIRITANDHLSGIESWNMHVDGQWILMGYDPKKNLFFNVEGDSNIPKHGEFIFEVIDFAGNKTTLTSKR